MTRRPLDQAPTRDIGPYRLAHRIAVGGMAEVYRALWPQAAGGDRSVVIKRLLPERADNPALRAMFEAEAELGARIQHKNVVEVLDHGVDRGAPYLVLEYVFGVDLWQLLRWVRSAGGSLSMSASLFIATELLDGLQAVHALEDASGEREEVVHRDVSPENIFLSVHGEVKLGDLGIARASLIRSGEAPGGAAADAKGKLRYLSPEQVNAQPLTPRADVFSAAAVLAELLAGRPLFDGQTELAVLVAIRDADVRAFRSIGSTLPEGLTDVVLAALNRDPARRTKSASEFASQLRAFLVTPPERCRAELGRLVVSALDAETSAAQSDALMQTAEHAVEQPPARPAAQTIEDPHPPRYTLAREGEALGEYDLAGLVSGVTTGAIQSTDEISRAGQRRRRVRSVRAIARHMPASRRTPAAQRVTELRETAERWDLANRSTIRIMHDMLTSGETGLLLVERGQSIKEVYLEHGAPAFVTSNLAEELLGARLVEEGVVSRSELGRALAALERYDGRLGEALIGLGLLRPVALVEHMVRYSWQRLLQIFEWREGHGSLYRDLERPERAFRLNLDPWRVLTRGMARRRDALGTVLPPERRVMLGAPPHSSAPELLRSIARSCRRARPVAAVLTGAELHLGLTRADATTSVALLFEIGSLMWVDPEPTDPRTPR